MDELIVNIAEYAYPAQESIKSSDFSANVKNLTEYIISIFRNLSLQFVPPFLNGFLLKIESDAKSDDKRKRYAAAVCLSSLFDLFPIDEYISQYKKVVEPLLTPGYKPILHIGAMVVGNLALIIGDSKDLFLHNLVTKCFNDLKIDNPPDVRYAAAVIWSELAKTIPEIFYTLSNFELIILENLQSGDRVICELLINVLYSLFTSESSSVGSSFLLELQDLLISTTSKNFLDSWQPEKIIIFFQLLNVLLKLKPYFSKKIAENILFGKCVALLKDKNFEIVLYSIETILRLYKFNVIKVEKKLYDEIINVLFEWSKEQPTGTLQIFEKFILSFPDYLDEISEPFLKRLSHLLKVQDGPLFVYNMIVTAIASLPTRTNIVQYLSFMTKMMSKSNVPIPIYTILSALNSKRPKWTQNYIYFMNQIMYVIRQELISQSPNTARLNIALLALIQIPIRDLDDALELNSLIMTLVTNKDIQVREKIAETSIHLFTSMPDKIPLNTIIKIVKFALDDTSRQVRLNSIRAFKLMTYKLLSQPDVFPIFSRFAYDESPEVRKEALFIFSSLPAVTGTIVRNILLSSLKQITSEKECLTSETISMWIVFPKLLVAATPWLNIYAEAIFEKFINILDHRFSMLLKSEASLVLMNSAMFRDMDESLVKSLGKLYRICPDLIQIRPILEVYIKILTCPVHPRTKIHVLKSLKNLGKIAAVIKIMPNIVSVLIEIILKSKYKKLVIKAMKVIGSIGINQFQGRPTVNSPFFFRNSLTNQKVLKYYFVSNLIHFLNDQFKSTNIEKNRENIVCIITLVFRLQPEMITRYLEPFFSTYLKFIHDSTERPPVFFQYLRRIIELGGHLMMEKASTIYKSIQRDWQSSGIMTKEASEVFRSLVIATIGQCEVIMNPIISEAFILLKIPTKSQIYASEIFELLKTIAKVSPSYLSTIISGIAEFLSQSYSSSIQELSLEAIKFMLHHCKIENHLSFIKRCISMILLRPQQRFKDIANYLMNEVNSVTRSQSIEKITSAASYNSNKNKNEPVGRLQSDTPSAKTIERIHQFNLNVNKMINHLDINKIIRAEDAGITKWFSDLNKLLFPPSMSDILKAINNLQQQPEFTFEFAFIKIWNNLEILTQKEIAMKLETIFNYDKLQDFVLIIFANLIEFSILCEIDLGVDILLVAKKCEKARLYDKALFFLETYLIYNPSNELTDDFKRSLICLNQTVGRTDDAHSIALQNKDVMNHETWMKLNEWELALHQFDEKKEDPNRFVIDRIVCYSALDDWESILKLSDKFKSMQVFDQSCVAQYFWIARSYLNHDSISSTDKLNSFNLSCVYSVQECIEKAILNLRENHIPQAYEYVHLGWRYASASISAESKNSNIDEVNKLLFRAQQLYELNHIITLIRSNNFNCPSLSNINSISALHKSSHVWHTRLKYLKTNPVYQKELYKIFSLIQNDKEGLESFAFRILESTSKGQYAPLIPKMMTLFFPDTKSDQYQFATLCYIQSNLNGNKEEVDNDSINQAKIIYQRTNDLFLMKMIDDYIGKKIYVHAKKPDDLDKSFEYLQKANSNIKTMIKCNILLAYVNNDSKYASKVIELLSDQKDKLTSIQFHIMLVLLANFDISLDSILCQISEVNYDVFQSAKYTTILLLNHESENVKSCCKEILSFLCTSCPQLITYNLINNIHLPCVKDLILQLQSSNPTISSQMIQISKKLTNISNNLYEKWISALRRASDLSREGNKEEAIKTILKLKHTLDVNDYVSISKYNKEFLITYRETLVSMISHLEASTRHESIQATKGKDKENLNLILNSSFYLSSSSDFGTLTFIDSNGEFDPESANLLLSQMAKKQASLRVIPMSSFDEEIEKKNDWIISIPGLKDVKLGRVYNCLQKQENGFKVTFIGMNGKKYNFTLESCNNYYNEHFNDITSLDTSIASKVKISEQFMDLICSTVTMATNLTSRKIIELSPEVFLVDQMKGHISLYDLIISYYSASHAAKESALSYETVSYMKNIQTNSKGNFLTKDVKRRFYRANSTDIDGPVQPGLAGENDELAPSSKLTKSSSNSDFYNRFDRIKKFRELQEQQDQRVIAKAIVVTSKNAMSWIQRSSAFARSFGALSFLSYIMGGVSMSPYAIAFDKLTANVSYTAYIACGRPQPVPFRLTKMIAGALGSCCTVINSAKPKPAQSNSSTANNKANNNNNNNDNNNNDNNNNDNNNNDNNNNDNNNNDNNNINNNNIYNNNDNNSNNNDSINNDDANNSDGLGVGDDGSASILVGKNSVVQALKCGSILSAVSGSDESFVVSGPFVSAMEASLQSLRRQKGLFAPCLQFFLQHCMGKKKTLPRAFIERFMPEKEEPGSADDANGQVVTNDDEINLLYSRIDGEKSSIQSDINKLIAEATNAANLIKMPPKWISWW